MTARRLLPALVALTLVLALAGGAGGTTTASNRLAAEQDAAALLQRFVAPAGVQALRSIPPRAGWWLRSKFLIPPHVADRFRLWQVDAPMRSVVAFVREHQPRGSSLGTNGGTSGDARYLPSHHFIFRFHAVPGRLWSRNLYVAIVRLSARGTALRVDAQDGWVWTQTARDRLPDGVRVIDVTRARWSRNPAVSRRVRDPGRVRRIVGWVRALDVVPPKTGCPVEGLVLGPALTLSFRGAGGALLARIRIFSGRGVGGPPACQAMEYSVRGRARPYLVGGTFPERVERLVGVKLY